MPRNRRLSAPQRLAPSRAVSSPNALSHVSTLKMPALDFEESTSSSKITFCSTISQITESFDKSYDIRPSPPSATVPNIRLRKG